MAHNSESYRPIKFLDQMEQNKHTVMLYDDQKYADIIIARYLQNGLEKGESCIFFTADDPSIVEAMLSAAGIDVEFYKKNNMLRIFSIERSDENKLAILSTLWRVRKEATRGMKPPYRFTGRTIIDTATVKGMELGMTLEKMGHEHFNDFDNSQLCFYEISSIEPSRRDEWIRGILKNHHHVIYASDPDRAVAFETDLLEEGE
jgi:hypothetical protein